MEKSNAASAGRGGEEHGVHRSRRQDGGDGENEIVGCLHQFTRLCKTSAQFQDAAATNPSGTRVNMGPPACKVGLVMIV